MLGLAMPAHVIQILLGVLVLGIAFGVQYAVRRAKSGRHKP